MSESQAGEFVSSINISVESDPWVRGMTNKLVEQNALILKANIDLLRMLGNWPITWQAPKKKEKP